VLVPVFLDFDTGMSVPTRIVAWRLSRVMTLGRDSTSALLDVTSALMRAAIWVGVMLVATIALPPAASTMVLRMKLNAEPPSGTGPKEPIEYAWLPLRRSHWIPSSSRPSLLISSTSPSMKTCRAGRSIDSWTIFFSFWNCSG